MSRTSKDHSDERIVGRPFLRWAGGKSRIVRHLIEFLPEEPFREYWEPFLGAGALFFALAPRRAHLSDSNSEMISCFRAVRDRPDLVFRYLREHLPKTSKEYYYQIRQLYNTSGPSIAQAARFLYLNRAGFNGIYRVNRKGEYNVPYGHKEPPPAPSREDLQLASRLLRNASLSNCPYEIALTHDGPRPGDFVYLDPPYPPLNETSNFTHYTTSRFSWKDQENVAQLANEIRNRNCFVMVSNSDIERVRGLYSGWHIHTLPVTRWIAANGSRYAVAELVATNYPVIRKRE
jgi:DNA adenine methylase